MNKLSNYLDNNIGYITMVQNYNIALKLYLLLIIITISKCYDTNYSNYNYYKSYSSIKRETSNVDLSNIKNNLCLINNSRMPKKSASMPNLSCLCSSYSSTTSSTSSSPYSPSSPISLSSSARSISRSSSLTGSLDMLNKMDDNKYKNILNIKKKLYDDDIGDLFIS